MVATLAARKPLVSVHAVEAGHRMVAITGSSKFRTLQEREGVVLDFAWRPVGNGAREVKEAIVQLDSGETVRTHRLTDIF